MAININELSLTVTGNVVKNNDEQGNTVLRATQEQAREIFNDLSTFFAKNGGDVDEIQQQPGSRDPSPPLSNVSELPR